MGYSVLASILAAAAIAQAVPAAAIVYSGFQSAGPNGSGTISVTTDGTLGVLSAGNIVSFSISSTINGIDYNSVSGGPGSDTTLLGTGLSATSSQLIFNFSGDGLFGIADFVPGNTGFCVDGLVAAFTCGGIAPSLQFFATLGPTDFVAASEARTGIQVIASAVPEPATWWLLVTGTGLVGAGLRMQRRSLRRFYVGGCSLSADSPR